jgi:hypothetical protein
LKILYLVHDLNDAAAAKRVTMFKVGGADIVIAGFRRAQNPVTDINGYNPINLGQTFNGQFLQRIKLAISKFGFLESQIGQGHFDTIVARNLETLGIGFYLLKNGYADKLVYECLDIHKMMLRNDAIGKGLRFIERHFIKKCDAIITSSPAFTKNYFIGLQNIKNKIILLENKVFIESGFVAENNNIVKTYSKPLKIGWFGVLRCKKSLNILSEFALKMQGAVEIIMRGKPAYEILTDFDEIVAKNPYMKYLGAYKAPQDLFDIYSEVHYTWAIDFYEEGQNSKWLLPNRLYEGCLYQSIPIVQKGTQTEEYLTQLGIGVALDNVSSEDLGRFFLNLDAKEYTNQQSKLMSIDPKQFVANKEDCIKLLRDLN